MAVTQTCRKEFNHGIILHITTKINIEPEDISGSLDIHHPAHSGAFSLFLTRTGTSDNNKSAHRTGERHTGVHLVFFILFFISIQEPFYIKRSNHTVHCVSLKDLLNPLNRVNSITFVTCKHKTQTEGKIPFLCSISC